MTSNSFGWQFITSVDEVHTWYLCFTCMTFNYSFIHSVSQPGGPRFNPWHRQRFKICVTFFPAEVHSAFHPFKVGKMSTSIHGLHDAAGSGGHMLLALTGVLDYSCDTFCKLHRHFFCYLMIALSQIPVACYVTPPMVAPAFDQPCVSGFIISAQTRTDQLSENVF